jgi:outer membrane protein OmpA-like peptidoglycan-associated protein
MAVTELLAQNDVKGSADHPVVSRFNGSWIRFYEFNKFSQYKLRTSLIKRGGEAAAKNQTLEGTVTRIVYQSPKTVNAFEIYKSYEQALVKNGFEKIFACETGACSDGFGYSYPSDNAPHIKSYIQDQRYFAGRRSENDTTDIYVSLYTVFTNDGPVARLDIIETKKMDKGQVTVTASKIKSDFEKTGKAVINQIYFESGKAILKSSSVTALAEVAKFLKENPLLKIFVVGHTDNDGDFDFNLNLSQQRAEATVKELNTKYGISADRLKAKGVGYLCPVASNSSESGKAKNRRVELVKQ